jgi:hypothetical protein
VAANESYSPLSPERFPAKHALGLDPGVETGSRQESKRPLDSSGRFSFVSFCVSETHHA